MTGRLNAFNPERVLTVYNEDLDGLPVPVEQTIRAAWRDLANRTLVPACPHLADPHVRPELHDRLRPGIYVCCRHTSAGLCCPGCAARHLIRPANDHRRACPACGTALDPFALRPARVQVSVDLADRRDGRPAGTLSGAVVRTVGWELHRRCHRGAYSGA